MKNNFQQELDALLARLAESGMPQRPRLLLHACCGPCSSYVLEYLAQFFEITVFFYNPNIFPESEYSRRLDELKQFYMRFPPVQEGKVTLVECDYDPEEFYEATGARHDPVLAAEAEKGERCRRCYELRLKKAFAYAAQNGFDYFCTTLSISPFKDAEKINRIGGQLQSEKTKWLYSDFKKKGGFKRSLELSAEYGLYRQNYCGCEYSARNKK